ncbi:TerB family tellurite resistance protein [Hydrogenovibrio sp. JE_KL2]|uniref:TerB family tellurite resistance protein n=1 Tax=Hydrogenovibrio sp. JE_KL2 TaxID=2651188 RepID=UPI00128DB190|nr:TerB family tellurite resistance protein [Hydrogenovibrio sp. JE_KL2]MBN2607224.1 TerB family tellurite resistance protein [Thiotrichales bacterium]MPQ75602.1 TerB family tellurite resistance protein [Hydrogenovibrio sp. JE_KL2]
MFADRLTTEQRQAVFDLAVMLANADLDVSEEELGYLKTFSDAFGIEFDLDKSQINLEDTLRVFNSKQSKIILLQELIKLSYKDGHFGEEEQDKVFMISQKIGMNDPDLFLKIEKWVRQGADWLFEGEQMLEDGY